MEKLECQSCFKNQSVLKCAECENTVCKSCACFVDETSFEHEVLLPDSIRAKTFCPSCYTFKAEPVLLEYQEIFERAKLVDVYSIKQTNETSLIKRVEKPIKIKNCDDRSEALMCLAFMTAQKNYDTIVDVKLESEKVFDAKYRKLVWSGSGIPVDPKNRR